MNSFFEMANALADRWLDGMWPVIWQSAALAGIIYLLTLCLRRASAAVCFWLWMLVPLRLLVMPLITISLPLLPAATPSSTDIPIESMSARAMAMEPMVDIVPESAPMTDEPPRVSLTTAKLAAASHRVWPSAWAFLMAGWLAGVAFWSVRLLRSWCRIRRIARHAAQVSDDKILAVAKPAAAMLGLRRVPRILVTEEKISPFLFGIFRCVLVIPARLVGTVHDEQLRAVFAHEFAHVRRRDPLIGWVLAVCEAFYFFHPVFHFVKRRILFERERACDGWVIAAGKTGRSIYAHALINAADVCRSFRTKVGPVGAVAESFADLKKRLLAIGSNFKPRTRLSLSALILLVIIGAICVPGIVLTARSEGESERTDAQVGTAGLLTDDKQKATKFAATLPNGVTVELIGVCEHPSEGKQWWLPDGSVLPQKPYGTIKGDRAYFGADEKAYEFVVRLAGPADVDVKWKAVPDGGSRMTSFPHGSDGRLLADLRVLITKFHKRTASTLLRVGVAPKVPDRDVIQDYQWVEFKNVSLRPGHKTDVRVAYSTTMTRRIREAGKPESARDETYDFLTEVNRKTRLLTPKEWAHMDNWVSIVASVVKDSGRYLLPEDEELTLSELIRAAGYDPQKISVSFLEILRPVELGRVRAYSIFSRSLQTLFSKKESDPVLKQHDGIVGGWIYPSPNRDEFLAPYNFGDVVEITINDDNSENNMFVDLDVGKLVTPDEDLDKKDLEKVLKWMSAKGIDAVCNTAPEVRGLIGFGIVALSVDNYFWDVDIRDFWDRLVMTIDEPVLLSAKKYLPATYLIKTNEHKMGILQILGFTHKPEGVRIRYKLLDKVKTKRTDVRVEVLTDRPPVALDLDSGELMRLDKDWPDEYDVAWDNDAGGSLFTKPDGPVKMLPIVEAENFAHALSLAAQQIESLKHRTVDGMPAERSRYLLVKTSQDNIVVVEVEEYDESKAKIRWQIIQQPIGKTGVRTEVADEQTRTSSSLAWYIMRQWNAGPLLLGLTQRLGKVINSAQPDDSVWTGVANGGRLQLDIAVEGDAAGAIFVGFFKDAAWSAEPVQVRRFPAAGKYRVENLPPGKFQIGALIGGSPVATALGVQRTWPEPVEITSGATTAAEVLLSAEFQKHASGWCNQRVSRDYIGDWDDIDADNVLQGRVTGPEGRPVAFATVQVREHNPGAGSIAAPDCGTSEQGLYKCDRIAWPYRVGVLWCEPIPSVLGYRHQYLYYNRVFEGSQTVDFKFDSFPGGNAKLNGRVIDQNGEPLGGFHIDVSTKINWQGIKNPDGKFYRSAGYRIPFTSDDGTFELGGLPDGDVRVHVIPFKNQAYSYHRSEEIVLSAGKTSTIELRVTAKNVLFGRVLFKDGSPAVIKPPRWKDADTRVYMTFEGMDWASAVVTVDDDGYFAIYADEEELAALRAGRAELTVSVPTAEERGYKTMGKFPFERLSKDKSKAGVLEIEHPLGEPPSLADTPLPKFEGIEIEFSPEQAKGKKLLVCFWDMNQRPSRNLVGKLAEREKELEDKGVVVLLVHTSDVETTKLKEWVNNRKIPFACGNIKDDAEMVLFRWGVRALPWLVLMDEKGVVRAEGFTLEFLDAVLEGKASAEQMALEKGAGSDKVVLKLTDSDGWPVAGAQVGTNVRTRDVSTLGRKLSFLLRSGEHNMSNDWGEIVLTREKLFLPSWPADRKTGLYVLHEDRQIGAICGLSRDDQRAEIELMLEPVCHVHGRLDSEALEKTGRPLTWTNVYFYWDRDIFGVLRHGSEQQRFEFFVPPGQYESYAYGSGEGASTKSVRSTIEVEAGQSELDLGVLDLPPTKVTSLIGKPAPEFGPIKAWKNGPPVKLVDLRGKLVILHFGGEYPSTSRDLPKLVELHEDFKDAGLVIIAIYNCESMEQLTKRFKENAEKFGGDPDVPFRLAVDGGEGRPIEGTDRTVPGATYAAYEISSYPTTVLIGRQGQIIEKLNLSRAKEKLESILGIRVEPTLSGWRQQFYQVYRLEEGQVLKRIAPPFIPQRKDYYKQEHSHQAEAIERPPDYFTFHWDGELKNWGLGFGSGKRPLSSVLNSNLSIKRDKFEGPEDLLKIDLPGDWIVRKDVSEEEKLKALERILADEMGRNIRFVKRTVEREAIVATGRFQYRRLPVAQDDRYVHMFSGDFDLESGGGGGTADSVSQFLQALGNRVRVPVIDETEPSQQVRIPYRHHRSAYLGRIEGPAEKREKLTQLLDNLSRQTDLRFTVEPRPVEIWFVTEDKTDK